MSLRAAIEHLAAHRDLSESDMEAVMLAIMEGAVTPTQVAAFLVALRMKGECVEELVGAARVLRRYALKVHTSRPAVDACGTGGDMRGTFNISTAAALIAAGAGVAVAKHGNRAMSGSVGGADVLEALGVCIDLTPEQAAACLEDAGITFLFAQRFHPAMRHVAGPRRELGVRTIFNLLGPLANPAEAPAQLLGVYSEEWVEPLAHTLARLGSQRALVVHGQDGLDEISLSAPTQVAELRDGVVRTYVLSPREFDLDVCAPDALRGGDVHANAEVLRNIVAGTATRAQLDIALLNAAALIYVAGGTPTIASGLVRARATVTDGGAARALDALIRCSNSARREIDRTDLHR